MSRRHAPRATQPVPEGVHTCPCGQPAPDTHICATCAERVRDNLLTIAERWPELENALQWRETPNAGPIPPQPGDIDPDEGVGNVTGLTEAGHFSSARDVALIAGKIVADHPNFYPLYSIRQFTFNNIKQHNRNPLLYRNTGADGIKTGHTEQAGYGLTASAVRETMPS